MTGADVAARVHAYAWTDRKPGLERTRCLLYTSTDAADVFLHAPAIEKKRAALAVEGLPGLGELHAAALAGEKLHAELGFKLGDLARDGRLGDVQGDVYKRQKQSGCFLTGSLPRR